MCWTGPLQCLRTCAFGALWKALKFRSLSGQWCVFAAPVHLFSCKVNVRASHRILSVADSLMLSCYVIVQWAYVNECHGERGLCIRHLFFCDGVLYILWTYRYKRFESLTGLFWCAADRGEMPGKKVFRLFLHRYKYLITQNPTQCLWNGQFLSFFTFRPPFHVSIK